MITLQENTNEIFNFWDLTNADELFDEVVEKLKYFDKECNSYNTDVYLYVNEDGSGYLEDFTNVGGNSWLDDDHYVLFTDKQHYDDYLDWYQSIEEIADVLEMPDDELKEEALVALGLEDDYWIDEITFADVIEYIKTREDYQENLYRAFCDLIDDMSSEYTEKANDIIDQFNQNQKNSYEY